MKHTTVITLIILGIFIVTQYFGLLVVHNYIDPTLSIETGETQFKDLPIGERPEVNQSLSPVWLFVAVLFGTLILLVLIKFKMYKVWKAWFFMAVLLAMIITFGAFVNGIIALLIALPLAIWKTWKPNVIVHNTTEIFVYAGLAALLVPFFNVWSVSILLIVFSIYDMYAVWKSKHMITLAKAQSKSGVFAGLMIPYFLKDATAKIVTKTAKVAKVAKATKKKIKEKKPKQVKSSLRKIAMLGGGDLALPLVFAGVVLIKMGLVQSLIIPIFSMLGLGALFYYSKKDKFYPAMPFISVGCFVGLLVAMLI
jgi:presenilin-like A22 family membrane protease